ncbi:hypothetical protein IAE19_01030 [Acinetobacter sp. S40]|uniref:hypothetical protein n=1 Tax=Acinetobacter sp. S40 TaxID=2767434 RepID=UPI00190A435B|nr:hypothetical protein [Acinetobacter sp. S40]MBJ9984028.1 hypothetical protein [Acinetobacter sp. S40]
MRSQLIGAALITASLSMTAFAEQPVQAGETLESLSKAKVTTTVNGQPGSLEDLVNSGKVQLISAQSNPVQTQPVPPQDIQAVTPHQGEMSEPAAVSAPSIDPNAPAQAMPESAHPEAPAMQAVPTEAQDQNLNAAPEQPMAEPNAQ